MLFSKLEIDAKENSILKSRYIVVKGKFEDIRSNYTTGYRQQIEFKINYCGLHKVVVTDYNVFIYKLNTNIVGTHENQITKLELIVDILTGIVNDKIDIFDLEVVDP